MQSYETMFNSIKNKTFLKANVKCRLYEKRLEFRMLHKINKSYFWILLNFKPYIFLNEEVCMTNPVSGNSCKRMVGPEQRSADPECLVEIL